MRLTIKTKFTVAFVLMLALWAISTVMAVSYLRTSQTYFGETVNRDIPRILLNEDVMALQIRNRLIVGEILIGLPNAPADHIDRLKAERDAVLTQIGDDLAMLREKTTLPAILDLIDAFEAKVDEVNALSDTVIAQELAGNGDAANTTFHGPLAAVWDESIALSSELRTAIRDRATERLASNEENVVLAEAKLIALFAVSAVLSAAIGLWILRGVVRGLGQAIASARAIAGGDLTRRIVLSGNDEITDMLAAQRQMAEKLESVVVSVSDAARNVASGSGQMAATSEVLSQGANEQAAATEESSASIEEMAANIRQTSENADQTERIARQAAEEARNTGVAMTEAVAAVRDIAGKIAVVQEIARQTDLLALNAAVEAARAGESGRGFAVVAAEVRKLAERSQVAAEDISRLSAATVRRAAGAGESLSLLVPNIERTADLIADISVAARELAAGSGQLSVAMVQLDKVTQSNTSASEKLSSNAAELAAQADRLAGTIGFFRVEQGMGAARLSDAGQGTSVAGPVRLRSGSSGANRSGGGFADDAAAARDALDDLFARPDAA